MTITDRSPLSFDRDYLLSTHEYVAPHLVAGRNLHGGMLADGSYQPPRALGRVPAMDAWEAALVERGGAPFPASAVLLVSVRHAIAGQQYTLGCTGQLVL